MMTRGIARTIAAVAFVAAASFHIEASPASTPEDGASSRGAILMFVSQQQTYYSEYIVMRSALEAAGYTVDLRSARSGSAELYMLPDGTDIEETANTLPGGSYAQFTTQFQNLFGSVWNAALDPTPSSVTVDGSVTSVASMAPYLALVVVGGTGAIDYRVDGSYSAQGEVTAFEVQQAAEKLNALAIEALLAGKPVVGQCHGASIPAYWRIPGTSGPGQEALGFSILKGQYATGYPEDATGTSLASLDIAHRSSDRVTVASPHASLDDDGTGDFRIMTTRDWYPQTIAHAARTLLDILETYPDHTTRSSQVSVLILHGGPLDPDNCAASNHANDVPCNHGTGAGDLPADYTNLVELMGADSPSDSFGFSVSNLNLTGALPFDPGNQAQIEAYLDDFDVVVFFKHWSTGVTDALQNALVAYADDGGGVLALHHALYNQPEGGLDKDILTAQLFAAESASGGTFSLQLLTYRLFNTGYGHFITTYGIPQTPTDPALEAPGVWSTNPLPSSANTSHSTCQNFDIYDELYGNTTFEAGVTFGRGVNQITSLLSNDQTPAGQAHTSGFARLFDSTGDGSVGRVAVFQAGERVESFAIGHAYAQLVRNAVVWLAHGPFVAANSPSGVTAIATAAASVSVSWNAVPGATSYRVYRREAGIPAYELVATTIEPAHVDTTVVAGAAYLFKVRAFDGTTESSDSAVDLATTVVFTDAVLTVGATLPKAAHVTELREAVNAVRALAGESAASFTDAGLAAGFSIKSAHLTELRTALDTARASLGLATAGYSDSPITPGSTKVKAVHVEELRAGVR
jgi:putative intracellular protease/amidase